MGVTMSPHQGYVAGIVLAVSVLTGQCSRVTKPYVETYWESWEAWEKYPSDFGALLKDVPAGPVGSCKGANLINIAFGDYSGGVGGHEATDEIIREGIEAIHAKGGLVKIALGGALFNMGAYVSTVEEATEFAEKMLATHKDIGLDGMDLDVEDSGVGADVQVAVIKETRRLLGPDFHISYTIPATVAVINPWMDTISRTVEELDAVNLMALGLPANKVVYGIMPGHADAATEYVSIEDAMKMVDYSLEKGLGGVMTWDVNRDCTKRKNYAAGVDNVWQTGQGDGKYLDAISARINKY